jgi:LPXTG-site transpeptidase (sortase) family protein
MRNASIAGVITVTIALAAAVTLAATDYRWAIAEPEQSAPPFRLTIPSINVDAPVESVGLTPRGAVDSPKEPANAAWFNLGPRPGDQGSAVIDGHFGWKDNVPAVFDNLAALQAGDKVYVEDADGVTTTFVVRELRTYDPNDATDAVFRSGDGKAHLNLITCGGLWDEASKSYAKRLVVFTDKDTK